MSIRSRAVQSKVESHYSWILQAIGDVEPGQALLVATEMAKCEALEDISLVLHNAMFEGKLEIRISNGEGEPMEIIHKGTVKSAE